MVPLRRLAVDGNGEAYQVAGRAICPRDQGGLPPSDALVQPEPLLQLGQGRDDRHRDGDLVWDLAKLGFNWQFITLAGFHCNALGIDNFAKDYAQRGAAAYVQLIQRQERLLGVETLTHQKWSGAELVDKISSIVSGGRSSTGIMSAGVTETQFSDGSDVGEEELPRDFIERGNAKPIWRRQ